MKLLHVVAVITLALFVTSPATAREQAPEYRKSVTKSGEKPDVQAALTAWKTAVESASLDDVIKLYDKEAIMISTFAQEPMTKHEQIVGYFKKVLPSPDIKVEIEETHPRLYGNVAVNSGRYTLSYSQEGETISIPARFTFIYTLQGGKWIIVEQHSSRVPLPDEDK